MRRVGIALLIVAVCGLVLAGPAQAQSDGDKAKLRKELIRQVDKKIKKLRAELIREIDRRLGTNRKKPVKTEGPNTTRRTNERGFLGIALRPLKPGMRALLGIPKGQGVMVDEVVEGSAAAKAKLRRTDVILAWNGAKLASEADLAAQAKKARAGDVVNLTIIREGRKMQVKAKLLAKGEKARVGKKGDKGEDQLENFLDKALKGSKKKGDGEKPANPDDMFGGDNLKKMMEQFGANPEQMQQMLKQFQEMMKDPEMRKRAEEMMKRFFGDQAPTGKELDKRLKEMLPPEGKKTDEPKKADTPRKKGDEKINKMLDDLLGKGGKKKPPTKTDTPKKGGKAYLGVTLSPVTETMRQQLKLKPNEGVLISSVVEGTAAAKAGLERWDVLVRWGKHNIASTTDVRKALSGNVAGDTVKLVVVRKGKRRSLEVTLGSPQKSKFK